MQTKESGDTTETKRSKNRQAPDDFNSFIEQDLLAVPDYSNKSIPTVPEEPTAPTVSKRISSRQRKESLEEYRETFLTIPKIEDRKTVFVSGKTREQLDEIVRKLGTRGMSVSGFIENLARHHLGTYQEDIEVWRKL